jgi:Acetyltransferase (GNAT) family
MMYAEYVKERLGKDCFWTEKGFATFSFTEDAVYIEDLFVLPEFRKSSEASNIADNIAEIAKARGYKKMLGSVIPSANGSTVSMKVLLAYGFEIDSSSNNFILLRKEI